VLEGDKQLPIVFNKEKEEKYGKRRLRKHGGSLLLIRVLGGFRRMFERSDRT
jgi:hypothetical protein